MEEEERSKIHRQDAKKCAVIPAFNPPWRAWRLGSEKIQVTREDQFIGRFILTSFAGPLRRTIPALRRRQCEIDSIGRLAGFGGERTRASCPCPPWKSHFAAEKGGTGGSPVLPMRGASARAEGSILAHPICPRASCPCPPCKALHAGLWP
jgi:hypothetical protein